MGSQVRMFRRAPDGSIEERTFDTDDLSPPWYPNRDEVPPLNPVKPEELDGMTDRQLRAYNEHHRRNSRNGAQTRAELLAEAKRLTPEESPDAKPLDEMTNAELQGFISRQKAHVEPAREREQLLTQARQLQADNARLGALPPEPKKDGADTSAGGEDTGGGSSSGESGAMEGVGARSSARSGSRSTSTGASGSTSASKPVSDKQVTPLNQMTDGELRQYILAHGGTPSGDHARLLQQAQALEANPNA